MLIALLLLRSCSFDGPYSYQDIGRRLRRISSAKRPSTVNSTSAPNRSPTSLTMQSLFMHSRPSQEIRDESDASRNKTVLT